MAEALTPIDLASRAVDLARRAGAEHCDAFVQSFEESTVAVRLGEVEKLLEAGSRSLGLRVITGGRTAVCSTSDFTEGAFEEFVRETVALARISASDEYAGLPDPEQLAKVSSIDGLQLYDEQVGSLSTEHRLRMALACEAAALDCDSRITNSDGATVSAALGEIALANSHGFAAGYPATSISLVVEVMADDAEGKKRNAYWYSSERSLHRLAAPEHVGRVAGQRAVAQLGARKVGTRPVPVVFEPMMAAALLRDIAGCATGSALYRGATFLSGRAGGQVGSALVTIVDDPLLPGCAGSRPFDGEGVATRRRELFAGGVFQGFLHDVYTARRTGSETTGSAHRGVASAPSPGASNLVLEPGTVRAEDVVAGVEEGFYVTALMGMGFNPSTGDYSRGAAGFWIEHGAIAYPVTEVNISGNVAEMLAAVEAVGEDLTWFGSVAAPTVCIGRMTVSGL